MSSQAVSIADILISQLYVLQATESLNKARVQACRAYRARAATCGSHSECSLFLSSQLHTQTHPTLTNMARPHIATHAVCEARCGYIFLVFREGCELFLPLRNASGDH